MKALILGSLFTALVAAPSFAADDTFLQAVGFALTGTDDAHVGVVDRASCVFRIEQHSANFNSHDDFHLNNIDVDRLAIQGWVKNTLACGLGNSCTVVDLHGESTVYEHTEQLTYDPNEQLDQLMKEKKPDYFEPHHSISNQHTLSLPTSETDRVKRAWQFIYSHGCKGARSPF